MKKSAVLLIIAAAGLTMAACGKKDNTEAVTVAATEKVSTEIPVTAVTVSEPKHEIKDFLGAWKYQNTEFVIYLNNTNGSNTWEMKYQDGRSYLSGTFTHNNDVVQLYETTGADVGVTATASKDLSAESSTASTASTSVSAEPVVSEYLKLTLTEDGYIIDSQGAILERYTAPSFALQEYLDYWVNEEEAQCYLYFSTEGTWTQYDLSGNLLDSGDFEFNSGAITLKDSEGNDLNTYTMTDENTIINSFERIFKRSEAPEINTAEETQETQETDADASSAYYYYDNDGDIWYWDGAESTFIAYGSAYYITDDGQIAERQDAETGSYDTEESGEDQYDTTEAAE